MFYNTGISTYIWWLTNRKSEQRQGETQLIDASDIYQKIQLLEEYKTSLITKAVTGNIDVRDW